MLEYNPEIDEITSQVGDEMKKMFIEYQSIDPSIKDDYLKGAAMIVFRLGFDYFWSIESELSRRSVLGGGALVRLAFENLADLFYIYDKPNKYPEAYVESMSTFRDLMKGAAGKDHNLLASSRAFKQANKWTGATIEDRVKASGASLVNVYDLLSYFAHPNPGALIYVMNEKLQDGQLNLLKQANCLCALTMMGVVLNHSDIQSVKIEDLDEIAKRLGTRLLEDTK